MPDGRYQFQWWALSLIRARPLGGDAGSKRGKKGSDRGIDGEINFIDETSGKLKRALVHVKGGKVSSGDIRDLRGTVEREGAALGMFITLEEPSREMRTEAISAGHYRSPGWNQNYPKVQLLTIDQLLRGTKVEMPPQHGTFKEARRVETIEVEQHELIQALHWHSTRARFTRHSQTIKVFAWNARYTSGCGVPMVFAEPSIFACATGARAYQCGASGKTTPVIAVSITGEVFVARLRLRYSFSLDCIYT